MTASVIESLMHPRIAIPALVVTGRAITRWNDAAHDLLGGKLGQPIDVSFDIASRAKVLAALAAAPASCEVLLCAMGREPTPTQLSTVPIRQDAQLVLVARTGENSSESMAKRLLEANDHLTNLTRELSKQSAELEAARQRFESLADLRAHFVSMLAHDVRGALQGIVLSSDVIERAAQQGAGEEIAKGVGRVRGGAQRIRELVEKVLESARAESDHMIMDARPVSMRTVAQEAFETYAPVAGAAGITVSLIEHGGAGMLAGDRVRLGQVVGNLIENAIRHSPAGGTITVEVSEAPDLVRLAVRDQGPGIPYAVRDRLFDRFIRGPGRSGSLGLGLYVARQLVHLHHGRIVVEDVVPHGAAFVIEIPMMRELQAS